MVATAGCGGADAPDAASDTSADSGATVIATSIPAADSLGEAAGVSAAGEPPATSPATSPTGATLPAVIPPASSKPAVSPPASARGGDAGARILSKTSAKYAGVRTMTADFAMRTENPLLRSKSNSRGKLYQQRPDRIALRYSEPADEVILSDGQFFWVYLPSMYKGQVIKSPASAGGSNAVDLQAQFVGNPVERFQYTMQGTETVAGRATDVIVMVPRTRAQFKSLKVWIDRSDALVRRFEFVEHSGVIRHIELSNLRTNVGIPASTFKFTPPAGVRVVGQ